MKVTLNVEHDSWSSYPCDEIEFVITDTLVHAKVEYAGGDDRLLSFRREEFAKLLRLVEDRP